MPARDDTAQDMAREISDGLSDQLSRLLAKVVVSVVGDDWTWDEIIERMNCTRLPDKTEIFILDGKPILKVYPVRFECNDSKIAASHDYKILRTEREAI